MSWTAIARFVTLILIIAVGVVYVRGWRQLHQSPDTDGGDWRHLFSFLVGLTLLAIVTATPLAGLSTQYFSARSFQQMVLVASVPAMLIMANPLPTLLLGLPTSTRQTLITARDDGRYPTLRRMAYSITAPGVTLIACLSICWIWYDPRIHQATLTHGWVHALEIVSLFAVGLLTWWHISGAWPRPHGLMPPVVRIFYTTISIWPLKIAGLILLFVPTAFYSYPATWQFSGLHINDYAFGAMITWIVGGLAYAITAILLARDWLGIEEGKPILPESAWASDEALLAPGLKQ
ncbi:MAG: cytochrome c oxidase assembly protein [Chloroflexota bacterium]